MVSWVTVSSTMCPSLNSKHPVSTTHVQCSLTTRDSNSMRAISHLKSQGDGVLALCTSCDLVERIQRRLVDVMALANASCDSLSILTVEDDGAIAALAVHRHLVELLAKALEQVVDGLVSDVIAGALTIDLRRHDLALLEALFVLTVAAVTALDEFAQAALATPVAGHRPVETGLAFFMIRMGAVHRLYFPAFRSSLHRRPILQSEHVSLCHFTYSSKFIIPTPLMGGSRCTRRSWATLEPSWGLAVCQCVVVGAHDRPHAG